MSFLARRSAARCFDTFPIPAAEMAATDPDELVRRARLSMAAHCAALVGYADGVTQGSHTLSFIYDNKAGPLGANFMCFVDSDPFLFGAEVFTEYYAHTEHLVHMRYMFTGVEGHTEIVPFMWASFGCSVGTSRFT